MSTSVKVGKAGTGKASTMTPLEKVEQEICGDQVKKYTESAKYIVPYANRRHKLVAQVKTELPGLP